MNSVTDPVDSGLCSVSSTSSIHSQDYLTEESDISRKGLKHSDSVTKDENDTWEGEQEGAPFGYPPSFPAVMKSAAGLLNNGSTSASITCPPAEPITEANLIQQVEQQLSTEKSVQQSEEEENRGYRCEVQSSEDMLHSGDGEVTGDTGTAKKKRKKKKKKKKAKGEVSSGLVSPAESASSDQATNQIETQEHIPGSPNRISIVKVDGKYVTDVNVQGKYMIKSRMRPVKQTESVQEATTATLKSAQEIELDRQSYRTKKKDTKFGDHSEIKNTREVENDTAKEEAGRPVSKIRHSNNVMLKDKDSNVTTKTDVKKETTGGKCDENVELESLQKTTNTGGNAKIGNVDKKEENRVYADPQVDYYALNAQCTDTFGNEQGIEDSFELVENKRSKKRQNKMQLEQVAESKFDRQKAKGVNLRYRAKGPLGESKNKQALMKEGVMSALYQSSQVEGPISPDMDATMSQTYARRSRPNSAKASDHRHSESTRSCEPPSANIHISRSAPHLPLKHLEDKIGQLNGLVVPTSLKQNLNFPDEKYESNEVLHFDCESKEKQTLTRSDSLPEIPVSKGDFPVSASQSAKFSVDDTYASRLKKNLMTGPGTQLPSIENTTVAATCVKDLERRTLYDTSMDSVQTSSSATATQVDQTANQEPLPSPVSNKSSEDIDTIQFLSAFETEELGCDKANDNGQSSADFPYQKLLDKSCAVNSGKVKNKGILFPLSDPDAFAEDEDLGISFGTVVFKSGHLVLEPTDFLESLKRKDGTELLREKHECANSEDCKMFNHKEIARFLNRAWKAFTKEENSDPGKVVYYSTDG
ncbi:uncharacterized protein LOC144449729 [Glandiceps talaboti]